jgi:hypothetical protein
MRRWLLTLLLLTTAPAHADEAEGGSDGGDSGGGGGSDAGPGEDRGTLGVGIIIGEPTGVCGRLYLADDRAIQAAVGAAFLGGGLQLHADYAFHPYMLPPRESFRLVFYTGPGVRVIQYADGRDASFFALGLRAVGGMLFDFESPLDAFFEVAGVLEYGFADGEGFGVAFNAGAGVRYYF